jgi:hypothetical protein
MRSLLQSSQSDIEKALCHEYTTLQWHVRERKSPDPWDLPQSLLYGRLNAILEQLAHIQPMLAHSD